MQEAAAPETTPRVMPKRMAPHVIRLPYDCNLGGLALSGSVSIGSSMFKRAPLRATISARPSRARMQGAFLLDVRNIAPRTLNALGERTGTTAESVLRSR